MNRYIAAIILAVASMAAAFAQTPPVAPLGIKGDLRITYNTRGTDGKVKTGAVDTYSLNLRVAESATFKGTIQHRPFVRNTVAANQNGQLVFDLDGGVINPRDTTQTKDIAKLTGVVPVDAANVYRFEEGNLKMVVFGAGAASGLESRFGGLAHGKPPAASGFAKIKQETLRLANSKGAVVITRYDQMLFAAHKLAAGPVPVYGECVVSGALIYDYNRSAWMPKDLNVTYAANNRRVQDTITGHIRWTEPANRKSSGLGSYLVDLKVNEPAASEATVFGVASTEADFFSVNTAVASLTGTLAYQDTMINGIVTASVVKVDLVGSQLDKLQLMYLAKLLLISAIVPVNAE